MRLTEPGLYVARDGRVAIFDGAECGILCARDGVHRPYFSGWFQRDESGVEVPGEWQRIDLAAVKWPELPPKPPGLCLVKTIPKLMETSWVCMAEPTWVTVYSNNCYYRRDDKYPSSMPRWGDLSFLEIVPHPDNDREAEAMIEAAKEANNG